jgi:hypothetical protein
MNTYERGRVAELAFKSVVSVGLVAISAYFFSQGTSEDYSPQYPSTQQSLTTHKPRYEILGPSGTVVLYCQGGTYLECYDAAYPPPPGPAKPGNATNSNQNLTPVPASLNTQNPYSLSS